MRWTTTLALGFGLSTACTPATEGSEGGTDTDAATTGSTAADPDHGDAGWTDSVGSTGLDSGGPNTSGPPDDTTGDPTGQPGDCQQVPVRLVVLGDSIVACVGVGGKDSPDCAPKRVHDWLSQNTGPLAYQNLSVGGAVTSDVANNQLGNIEVGVPGHALVMIYIGGNDLAQYIAGSDDAAINGWRNTTGPEVAAAWEEILAFLDDEANFPDGVTLLVNTQYNPFDDCTAPPYNISEIKIDLLHQHNQALRDRATSREYGYFADQHPSYLGHGHYWNDASCPYYDPSFEGWMNDLIHPNAPGHHHVADVMIEVAQTQIYGGCQ